jgi:hypothetical protein
MSQDKPVKKSRFKAIAIALINRKLFWSVLIAGIALGIHHGKASGAVMPDWVPNPVQWAAAEFYAALTTFWDWAWNIIGGITADFFDMINAVIPDLSQYRSYILPFATLGGIINYWLPLSDLLICIGIYWALSVALVLYRVIKSFIPTVSG